MKLVWLWLLLAFVPIGAFAQDEAAEQAELGPRLEAVQFFGREYFREETLQGFLTHPVPGRLDEAALERDRADMEARYRDRGFLHATVAFRLTPGREPRGFLGVFDIASGERAELREVRIMGNQGVSDEDLMEGFFSRPPHLLGALTRAGFFHRPYLDQDAQRLVANYYQRGYLEARVTRTEVEATKDLEGLAVTLYAYEGHVYEVGGIAFEGDLPPGATSESLRELVTFKDGDVANLVAIQQEVDSLLDPLRDAGFAFARVEQNVEVVPPPSGDPERRGIRLVYRMARGDPVKVRKVRIVGDHGTLDYVILRDVAVKEDEPYQQSDLTKSQRRLMGLGFFSDVVLRAVPVPGQPELVDVEIAVTEQPTWLASLAPSWGGQVEGLVGIGILADRNLLGTGIYGSVQGVFSGLRQLFDVQIVEPRLLGTDARLFLEGHRRELRFYDFLTRSEAGGGFNLMVPVGFGFFLTGGAMAEFGGVVPLDDLPLADTDLLPQNRFRNVLSGGILLDRRDSFLTPRNGVFSQITVSHASPYTLSGLSFLAMRGNLRFFWSPLFDITLKTNTDVGWAMDPFGGRAPVTDRFFPGGFGSIRGYAPRSISPVENVPQLDGTTHLAAVGGVFQFVQNVEVEFPLWPGTPFRGFVFFDAGNTFGESEPWFSSDLKREPSVLPFDLGRSSLPLGLYTSVGFGIVIETPVLPFRFEWGIPLARRPGIDRELDFFLGVGSAF
jgi:outer membrane protein insertion porin family